MADNRSTWSYIDEFGVTQNIVPVSVQGQEWADSAPATEIRDPNNRTTEKPRTNGWKGETPLGDEFNYDLRRNSLLLSELESKGVLSWSAVTNYSVPAMVWASDNQIYFSVAASGPDDPAGIKDPLGNPAYWNAFNVTPDGYKRGFIINPNVTLPTTKIDFSPGIANTAFGDIKRILPITKIINNVFTEGDNLGGQFQGGVLQPNGYMHAFIIVRDDGLVDAGFDDNIYAAHLPVGYYAYFLAGSVNLDSQKNIVPFIAKEREGGAVEYFPKNIITITFTGTLPAGRQLLTLPIPPAIEPVAKLGITLNAAITTKLHVAPTFQDIISTSGNNGILIVDSNSTQAQIVMDTQVDINGQISWELIANFNIGYSDFITRSWIDKRLT